MKKLIILAVASLFVIQSKAQVYKTATGNIKFVNKTAIEEFTANNDQVTAAFSVAENAVVMRVPVNSFQFKSALMQKHFQENYLETNKFPFSTYVGKINDAKALATASGNLTKNGEYPVETTGTLEMHGVKKPIVVPGKIIVKDGLVTLSANFNVKCSDYEIKIPAASAASVSNDIAISVSCPLKQAAKK